MPEGPECKSYADALHDEMGGKEIVDIQFLSGRYKTGEPPTGIDAFVKDLPLTVRQVSCKGKFIYFKLDNSNTFTLPPSPPKYIWSTLGLTGGWAKTNESSSRFCFTLSDGVKIYFVDQRNFGTVCFNKTEDETKAKLKTLGFDFLHSDKSFDNVTESFSIFRKKKNFNKPLCEILMDQSNYAGVGNYIKAEALYQCRLSPHRLGLSLNPSDIESLHDAIKNVMRGSYLSRHPELYSYFNLDEADDRIFKKLIYKQTKDPLGNDILAEATSDGRTTYWAPNIQK